MTLNERPLNKSEMYTFKRLFITFGYVTLDVKLDLATKWERHQLKINRFSVFVRQSEVRVREKREKVENIQR